MTAAVPRRVGRSVTTSPAGRLGDAIFPVTDDVLTLANGRRLGFRVRGDVRSQPLIYFHGEPGSRLEADLIPDADLRAFDVRVVSFDRPGMGRSDLIPARDMVLDVEDAIELADHLGIGRFAVIGVSAGGPPALAITATHPERVQRTVLCCSAGPYDDERFMTAEDIEGRRQALEHGIESLLPECELGRKAMLANPFDEIAVWFGDFPPAEREWITTNPRDEQIVADYLEALKQGARGWLRETEVRIRPWSFDPSKIMVPVRAFHGERDTFELIENTRRIIDLIPGATLKAYPGGDHLAPLMHPGDLLAAVTA